MGATKENYTLYRPTNNWDMNYRVVDEENNKEYLIDIMDVTSDKEEAEEENLLLFSDLLSLEDIEYIKLYAWKVMDVNPIEEFSRKFIST